MAPISNIPTSTTYQHGLINLSSSTNFGADSEQAVGSSFSIKTEMILQNKVKQIWGYDVKVNKFCRKKENEICYYSIGPALGSGVTAKVFALEPDDKKRKIKAVKISKNWSVNFENEYKSLKDLPFSEGIMLPPKAYFSGLSGILNSLIIMPKYDGTLFQLFSQMTSLELLDAIDQMLKGMEKLHDEGFYLMDMKLQNVFFRKIGERKRYDLADFGFVCRSEPDYDNEFYRLHSIERLGKMFKQMIFSSAGFSIGKITIEQMEIKKLPPSLAEVINYMIYPKNKDIKFARKLFMDLYSQ